MPSPNIIAAKQANLMIAKEDKSFVDLGFTDTNIIIVYEVDNVIRSWRPDGEIHPITGVMAGRGYWIKSLGDIESDNFILPQEAALFGTVGKKSLAFSDVGATHYGTVFMDKVVNFYEDIITEETKIAVSSEGLWPHAVCVITLHGSGNIPITFAANLAPLPGSTAATVQNGIATQITIISVLNTGTMLYELKYHCKKVYATIPNIVGSAVISVVMPSTIQVTFSPERNVKVPIYAPDWGIDGGTIASISQPGYGSGSNIFINLTTPALPGEVYEVTYLGTQQIIRGFNGYPIAPFYGMPVNNLVV